MNQLNLIATCFLFLLASTARADLTVDFSVDGGTTFVNTQTLTVGSTVNIEVYLRDTDTNGDLVNDGLFGFGLRGTGFGPTTVTRQNTAINPAFDFSVDDSTEAEILWNGGVFNEPTPTGQNILLGSFDLISVSPGTTTLSFTDINPGTGSANADWLTSVAVELDQLIFDPASGGQTSYGLTIVAVPEPAIACVLSGLAGVLSLRRRRTYLAS